MRPQTLGLTEEARGALVRGRDRAPRPCHRERCAALLKVAGGQSPRQVAPGGLGRRRQPETVRGWRAWRSAGRAPGLPPRRAGSSWRRCASRLSSSPSPARAGGRGTCWGRSAGRATTRPRAWPARGRLRLHSPDPDCREKEWDIRHVCALALAPHRPPVVLQGDAVSLRRQPALGRAYAPVGRDLAAPLSCRSNTSYRYAGALGVATGQLTWLGRSRMGVENLRRFLVTRRAAYPQRPIRLLWDDWPGHRPPGVRARAAEVGSEVPWLPTYAPWLNPIEKRWRWLAEDLARHRRRADRFGDRQRQVAAWLDRFAGPSPALLCHTGLAPCTDYARHRHKDRSLECGSP